MAQQSHIEYRKGDPEGIARGAKMRRNRRIRNGLLLTGLGAAAAVGTYLGVRKATFEISTLIQGVKNELEVNNTLVNQLLLIEDKKHEWVFEQMRAIDGAHEAGVKFKFYPGVGVRFKSVADNEAAERALKVREMLQFDPIP